jgi:hypothetical protein
MSKLKRLIGLQSSNLSFRALSRALCACGIGAAEADILSEVELERHVFGASSPAKASTRAAPDCA